jgi:CRISPR-associated protein Cmr6
MRPLYKKVATAHLSFAPEDGNTGLWYDKFCDRWCLDQTKSGLHAWTLETFSSGKGSQTVSPKDDWIKSSTGQSGDSGMIRGFNKRMVLLINSLGGIWQCYKTEGPFVTGLGREHPVENGFAWHHTLGTGYLPGSSVKGMLRSWACKDGHRGSEVKNRIFGPRDPNKSHVGTVIFLDAIPTAPVTLRRDVMTPHYAPYYQDQTGQTPPADWHNPIPIPFLVVDSGQTFLFGLLPRNQTNDHITDCQTATAWLGGALEWIGAGSKTAVGYGRFVRDDSTERRLHTWLDRLKADEKRREEKERAVAGLSPIAAELRITALEQGWETNKEAFTATGVVEQWLAKLEADPQIDAIEGLAALVRKHFPTGLLDDPDRVSGKKRKPDFKERQRQIAHRLNGLLRGSG